MCAHTTQSSSRVMMALESKSVESRTCAHSLLSCSRLETAEAHRQHCLRGGEHVCDGVCSEV